MFVYLIRCLINGKGYVGQTIQSIERRWYEHGSKPSECPIDRAIRKYGRSAFEVCMLAKAHTLGELNALEEYHIKIQGTLSPYGYNLLPGGNNHHVHSETRNKISKTMQGRKFSEEHRKHLSESATGRKLSASHIAKRTATRLKNNGGVYSKNRIVK
jgi:group I intron endonuclease